MIRRFALALAILPATLQAAALELPATAVAIRQETTGNDSYTFPDSPWNGANSIHTQTREGTVSREVWQIDAERLTTLQILAPLRQQLVEDGFSPLFECKTQDCGGFDFRFGLDTVPAPDMRIDLGDFRYFAAEKHDETAILIVSKTLGAGYVQIVRIGAQDSPSAAAPAPEPALVATSQPITEPAVSVADQLDTNGHVILNDLVFDSGAATLGAGTYPSLTALATYLATHPDRTIALVGHTDSSGSLDTNIALSRQRAVAVVEQLVQVYGVEKSQLDAQGMGYLAPVRSNLTPEGRSANRRVEAVLTSVQ